VVVNPGQKEISDPKIIWPTTATASSTSTTTAFEVEEREMEQIQEITLALKAYVTMILCIVVIALPTVLYYSNEDDRNWSDHAGELTSAFTIKQIMIQFDMSFTWPDFGLPDIQWTFTGAFMLMCVTLVGSYLTQALLWCAGEAWFAMPDATPGVREEQFVDVFSRSRLVKVSVGSCV